MFTSPVLFLSSSCFGITPGLTVDICGRASGDWIVASKFPPKVGRVIFNKPTSSSISNFVQSAVRPQPILEDTLGARSRPIDVAPNKTICGFKSFIIVVITFT